MKTEELFDFEPDEVHQKVGGVGFEPTKAEPTVLQTASFEPLGYPPMGLFLCLHSVARSLTAVQGDRSSQASGATH